MAELLTDLSNVFTLAFAVTSMFSMGLSLTMSQISGPLRDVRLVAMALVSNFVIVPAAAFLLSRFIPLEQDLQIGLLLFGAVAGAPLVPKLAQMAGGNVPFAVGLVVLLVVATVIYLPIVLPLLLPGVQVDALTVAGPLVLQLLVPLGVGLFVKARYQECAEWLQPNMAQIANTSLALMLVLLLVLNLGDVLSLVGSGAFLAVLLLLAIALVAGYLLGGPDPGTRRVMALGTGQRNFAAAFVIGTGNFGDRPEVLVMVAAASLVSMPIMLPVAGEFGKRSKAGAGVGAPAPGELALAGRDRTGRP
jgi:bile acid:Na+ symporter, BASS family